MDKVTFVYNKDTYNAYDAQRIVFEAGKFKSEIIFEDGAKRGNAKSIIGLLSAAAVRAMAEFISSKL